MDNEAFTCVVSLVQWSTVDSLQCFPVHIWLNCNCLVSRNETVGHCNQVNQSSVQFLFLFLLWLETLTPSESNQPKTISSFRLAGDLLRILVLLAVVDYCGLLSTVVNFCSRWTSGHKIESYQGINLVIALVMTCLLGFYCFIRCFGLAEGVAGTFHIF